MSWDAALNSPARLVWSHDGKCACGKRTYLFGQCPTCIRQEEGDRLLAEQTSREAAPAADLPDDGIPTLDLVGTVTGPSPGPVVIVDCKRIKAWALNPEVCSGR